MEEVCAKIITSGNVQGIGYRFFALEAAQALGVKGWVRNIAGGKVESLARGRKDLVEAFIEKLKEGPAYSVVTDVDVAFLECGEKFNDFRVTY